MKSTLIALSALSALGGLLVLPAWAASPSFNCAKASNEVEGLICRDAELASLDRHLADLYAVTLTHTPAGAQTVLKDEQRGWIAGRNDCWKSSDERGCVKGAYQDRIRELKDW